MIRFATITALLLLLCAAPLRADEGEQEDSQAATLFRDAWWAETGSGALDKAAEGYKQAVAAKGSDTIRARSLYRLAVVLQRMGKTEDGVRALERLAKEFPSETALLAKSKERLDEWTAEDLRTSFGDWYKRYQYSPAFQAKIVDLILKLGGADAASKVTARNELLTIGEPALPALREHADSSNVQLRYSVLDLMLELGVLPEPQRLVKWGGWKHKREFWTLLRASTGSEREAYRKAAAQAQGDYRFRWIAACLEGTDAVLDLAAKETTDTAGLGLAELGPGAVFLEGRPSPAVFSRLRAMVDDQAVDAMTRGWIARQLFERWFHRDKYEEPDPTGLTTQALAGWIGDPALGGALLPSMRSGSIPAPELWKAAADALLAVPGDRAPKDLLAAMSGQLRLAPPEADLARAIEAYAHVLKATGSDNFDTWPLGESVELHGVGTRPRAALAAALGRVTGPRVREAASWWWRNLGRREGAFEALLAWMSDAQDAAVRAESALIVATQIHEDVGRLTAVLADADRRHELRKSVFLGLGQHRELERLDWDGEGLVRLVETAMSADSYVPSRLFGTSVWFRTAAGTTRSEQVQSPFEAREAGILYRLLQEERPRELFFQAALEQPERFPTSFWNLLGKARGASQADYDAALERLAAHWQRWTVDQRDHGLQLFVNELLLGPSSERLTRFLRDVLGSADLDAETRLHLVGAMDSLTLADLKTIYDFSDPVQLDQAALLLPRLPADEAVYDAFVPALRPDGQRAGAVYERFKAGPESRMQDLLRRMLAHTDPTLRAHLLVLLHARDKAEDLPVWMAMLAHKDAWLRAEAAKALGRLYDKDAIKALARAVDDPDPNVRDAVLAALERIETTEKQKDRWREFAK